MITTVLITLFYLLTPALIIWLFNKYNWVTKVGTVIRYYPGIAQYVHRLYAS